MDDYKQIFKRKSFHVFRGADPLGDAELQEVEAFIKTLRPLHPEIRTEICIVPEKETTCKAGGQYCILFYSETKDGYLQNIGYLGEQMDLFLASKNIGALWYGMGKANVLERNGLSYVIMISIAKMSEDKFRKDMLKVKRKPVKEIWSGDMLQVAEIARYAPSACNTQPWYVEQNGGQLQVFRYKKGGKRGIIPVNIIKKFNMIDMGIFLYILEICLEHENYGFERTVFAGPVDDMGESLRIAQYDCCKLVQ